MQVYLQNIKSPKDLKNIPEDKLPVLATEIRNKIIEVVGKNGGHLASNLGVVELTIALHRVFDSPNDAIVWDVSHQSYAHKLLTGRYKNFDTIRTKDGISGFTRVQESPHDYFDAGHASSSISSAFGLLTAWDLAGKNNKVIAVIGDGALTGGMAYEALSHAGLTSKNLIVVVNDNQMSISRNTGAVSRYLSRLTTTVTYQNFKRKADRVIDDIPYFNKHLGKLIYRLKRGLKGIFLTNNFFIDFGFEYVGPLNGHNINLLEQTFRRVSKIPRPVVVHIVTKKGKGYSPAENDPSTFHGVGPFSISDGIMEKFDALSLTEAFSRKMIELGKKNEKITAITAAMAKGTGLDAFSRHYKDRFFDVGIAEEHAVTFAGGLAAGGMIPVTAIYSTFIQRSVDQLIEDIALPDRHSIFVFDRAGAVPSDGETHQGVFDIALLRTVPNLQILTAISANDLSVLMDWAVSETKHPVCIRWPKASCPSELPVFSKGVIPGRGLLIKNEEYAPAVYSRFLDEVEAGKKKNPKKILLVVTGGMYSEALVAARSLLLSGTDTDIYSMRFIKPFDDSYFISIASKYDGIVFVEDGVRAGGISERLSNLLVNDQHTKKIKSDILAFPDTFIPNGSRKDILEFAGLDSESIKACCMKLLKQMK